MALVFLSVSFCLFNLLLVSLLSKFVSAAGPRGFSSTSSLFLSPLDYIIQAITLLLIKTKICICSPAPSLGFQTHLSSDLCTLGVDSPMSPWILGTAGLVVLQETAPSFGSTQEVTLFTLGWTVPSFTASCWFYLLDNSQIHFLPHLHKHKFSLKPLYNLFILISHSTPILFLLKVIL